MFEKPGTGRAIITQEFDALTIKIPNKKNILIILFLSVWMIGWTFGLVSVSGNISRSGSASGFLSFWLVGWIAAGGFIVFSICRFLFGYEVTILNREALIIQRTLFGIGKKRHYDLRSVQNIELNPEPDYNPFQRNNGLNAFSMKGGKIKFDYGMETVKFAGQVQEAEARMIIERLKNSTFLKAEVFN